VDGVVILVHQKLGSLTFGRLSEGGFGSAKGGGNLGVSRNVFVVKSTRMRRREEQRRCRGEVEERPKGGWVTFKP